MGEILYSILMIVLYVLLMIVCFWVLFMLMAATLFGGGIAGVGIGVFYGFRNYFAALFSNLRLRR